MKSKTSEEILFSCFCGSEDFIKLINMSNKTQEYLTPRRKCAKCGSIFTGRYEGYKSRFSFKTPGIIWEREKSNGKTESN